MNPDNFGLNRPPFRSLSAYPGPQQLTLAGGLRRCLIAPDSVLVVTGPVGTGKTVSVRHALERLDGDTLVARIRRTHVDRNELLEQLLDEFEVDPVPASSFKRLTALHEVFRGGDDQRQVFIIVEDAERLGADVLAELESLTAADHDDSPGAHLILLGPPTLEAFLEDPLLLRLNQRIRRRTELLPFSASETRGYIEHCLREAGGSLASIIDDDAIAVVHDCSGGVARLVNAIAEAMLFAASERGVKRIDRRFALQVARDDFGYIVSDDEVGEESGSIDSSAAAGVARLPESALTREPGNEEAPQATAEKRTSEPLFPAPPAAEGHSANGLRDCTAARAGDEATRSTASPLPESQPASATDPDAGRERQEAARKTASDAAAQPAAELRPEPPPALAVSDRNSPRDSREIVREPVSDNAAAPETAAEALPRPESAGAADACTEEDGDSEADDIEDTHTELPAISGIFTTPDHSATDTALGALRNAAPSVDEKVADPEQHDPVEQSGLLEPVNPQPMSKSDGAADSQTIRALDDALRPDTQLLRTLDVGEEMPTEASAETSFDADATMPAAEAPAAAAQPEPDTSMTGTMPTLSEDLIADALAEPDDAPADSTPVSVPSTKTPAVAADTQTKLEDAAEDEGMELPTLSLEETGALPAADGQPDETGATAAPKPAPMPAGAETAGVADSDSAAEGQQGPLMPEITLDNALEEHQQEQQARLDEAQATAASSNDAGDDSDDEDEEQKRRLQTLAARFSEAKSLEDVMDDTAAETLFGEEFSQIAAAVTNLHKALGDTPDGQQDASEAANSGAFVEATEAPAPAAAASAPDSPTPDSGPDNGAAGRTAAAAAAGAAAPADGNGQAARPPIPSRADVDSSAMRRLEMVRALNKKAGKTPPPRPSALDGGPEEIVLGTDDPVAADPAAPEPIENQFGPSMTNTLRQLNAENIRKMQEAEEAEEAKKSTKKGGLLSRFRRG